MLWAGIKPGLDFWDEEGMFPGPESSLLWDPAGLTETSCWEVTAGGQDPRSSGRGVAEPGWSPQKMLLS